MSCDNGGLLGASIASLYPALPGIDRTLLQGQLQQALRQFCIESEIWRFAFELLPVIDGERNYRIPEKDGSKVVRVVSIVEGGCRIPERRDIDERQGQAWYMAEPGLVVFNRIPDRDVVLMANVVLRPDADSEAVPVEIVERWRETVEAWALWKLRLFPEKAWSDAERGMLDRQMYELGVNEARQVHLRNLLPGRAALADPYGFLWR